MGLAEGEQFAGYTIERRIGAGGMGEVYLVRHPRLPRLEALKILPTTVSSDPQFRQRFAREADIAATLWHPHIVAVHDRGEDDGQLWITMDYVDGTDAAQLLRDRYPNGLPHQDAVAIVTAIAEALDYAHERHLLHRDVKPANILLTNPGSSEQRILLADFGIAKGTDEVNGLTATNMAVGSVAYAAPEQLMGKALDGRADQYALACTAYHLLTGKVPFGDSNPAVVIGSHLSAAPPTLVSLRSDGPGLDATLARAMAKDPEQRFASCREFAAALASPAGPNPAAAATQLAPLQPGATHVASPPPHPPTQYPPPATAPVGYAAPTPWPPTTAPVPQSRQSSAPRIMLIGGGVVVVVLLLLVAYLGGRVSQGPQNPVANQSDRTPYSDVASDPDGDASTSSSSTASPSTRAAGNGDLGLSKPISSPSCDGQGIVVLHNVTTPGEYARKVQQALNDFPGSSYLRTDLTCPSLRARDDEGDLIYAVYRPAGTTQSSVCAAVRQAYRNIPAGYSTPYGKWLDYTHDPAHQIPPEHC